MPTITAPVTPGKSKKRVRKKGAQKPSPRPVKSRQRDKKRVPTALDASRRPDRPPTADQRPRTFSILGAAREVGLDWKTIDLEVKAGRLRVNRLQSGRRFITREAIDDWLRESVAN